MKKVKAGKLPKPKKVKLLGKDFIELSHKVADILEEEGRIPKQEKCRCYDGRFLECPIHPFDEPPKEKKEEPSMEELIDMATHGDTRLVKSKLKPKESCDHKWVVDLEYCEECRLIKPEEKKESWRDDLRLYIDEEIEGMESYIETDSNKLYADELFERLFNGLQDFIEKQIDSVKAQAYKDIMTIRKNGEEMSKITIERLEREIKEAKREVLDEIQGHLIDKGKLDGCFYLPKGFWVSLKHKEELE